MLPEYQELDLSLIESFHLALKSQQWNVVLTMLCDYPCLKRIRFVQTTGDLLVLNSVLDYAIMQGQYEVIFKELAQYQDRLSKPNLNTVISMLRNQEWVMIEMLFQKKFLRSHYTYQSECLPVTELFKRFRHPQYIESSDSRGIYWLYGKEMLSLPHKPLPTDIQHPPIGTGRPRLS